MWQVHFQGRMQDIASGDFRVTAQSGGIELIEAISDEWRTLAEQSSGDQPFYHPEFIAAYVRSFTSGNLLLLTARKDGTLKAVLPLTRERVFIYGIPAMRLRSPANALRFDLTKAEGPEGEAAVQAIWQELKKKKYDLIEFREVPEGGNSEQLVSAAARDGFHIGKWPAKDTLYIPLIGEGKTPWLNLARKSLIDTLKSSTRKIIRERGAAPVLERTHGHSKDLLERFFALEAAGWKGRNRSAIASTERNVAFHNEIAQEAVRQGYFCVDSLYCKDTLIAAVFSFVHRRKYFALKWAYDETFHKYAPGHLLLNAVLEKCAHEGYVEFDFMGEKYDYEVRWTSLSRPHAFLYIFKPNLTGRLIERLKFGVIPQVRRWKNGLSARKSPISSPTK